MKFCFQPFRGNPDYDKVTKLIGWKHSEALSRKNQNFIDDFFSKLHFIKVADLPYDTKTLLMFFSSKLHFIKVADLPYDTQCLSNLANDREEVNVKSIERCRWDIYI